MLVIGAVIWCACAILKGRIHLCYFLRGGMTTNATIVDNKSTIVDKKEHNNQHHNVDNSEEERTLASMK